MTLATSATRNNVLELAYDPDNANSAVAKATTWAEDTLKNLALIYNNAYVSWRA